MNQITRNAPNITNWFQQWGQNVGELRCTERQNKEKQHNIQRFKEQKHLHRANC